MKFTRLPTLLALLALLVLPAAPYAAEPVNLSEAKKAVNAYIDAGDYAKDLAAVALKAHKYLAKRVAQPAKPGQKLAIVFDIDETTLSNLRHIRSQDYGYVPEVWDNWVGQAQGRAILPVQTVYNLAVQKNVAVFFVTMRREKERRATERNLRDVGYETWTKTYFLPDESKQTCRSFKTGIRRQIVNEGYTIVANVGDQESDFQGGLAERTFKLPNPCYIVE